jgi:hypothetical protein
MQASCRRLNVVVLQATYSRFTPTSTARILIFSLVDFALKVEEQAATEFNVHN